MDEPLDDSDNNTLGLSAQDLRDPAAIVSLPSLSLSVFNVLCLSNVYLNVLCLCALSQGDGIQRRGAPREGGTTEVTEVEHV